MAIFGQEWLFFTFFDKVAISQLRRHNFKDKDTSFAKLSQAKPQLQLCWLA